MKRKIIKSAILIMMCTLFTGCTNNKNESKIPICKVENCTNLCMSYKIGHETLYSNYCINHTCEDEDCTAKKEENERYCSFHKEKEIILTNSQIKEVRKVVDEYCELLMSKHSNVLAVNIINDTPKTTTSSIIYRCNVVREDSNTNLATIYVYLLDDGTFKVDSLVYDKTE